MICAGRQQILGILFQKEVQALIALETSSPPHPVLEPEIYFVVPK